ncbi:type I restriction enzyme S subunit [Xanthomonas arboricola]
MNVKVEHWATIRFDDAFEQISTTGKTVKTAGLPTEGSYPVIDQGQAPLAGFLDSPEPVISNESPVIIFGDHTRAVKWVDSPFIPGADGVKVLALREPLDARFFYYHLRSLHLESKGYARHFSQVRDATYCLPPLAEQKRIAQKLDGLLAQIDTIKARIDAIPALLKRFRQSVLESAFSGKLTAEWRQLHPDTKPASITDVRQAWRDRYQRSGRKFATPNLDPTNLRDDLPPTWQATQIGITFDVFVGATPARDRTDFWKGSISWVSSAEVAFCRIRSTREKITEAGHRATSTNLHPPGTVMLAMIGQGKTRGQPAILAIDACHNQNTAALRVHEEYCVPEYLYYYLWGRYEETRRFGGGNNQQALNKKSVQSLPFPLAPLAEQTEIVRCVEQLFAYADQLETKVVAAQQRINALTQSLLAKAFRGKLVPQDPSDEPASVLLERIRAQRAATPKPKRGRKAATS